MQTLPEIASGLINTMQSVHNVQTKFELPYMYDLCNQYKAVQQRISYQSTGRISPTWTLVHYCEYEADLQVSGSGMIRFRCPAPVVLDEMTDGFIYIGTVTKNCAFRKLQNRAELAGYNRHRVTKSGVIKTIWSEGFLEVYGDPLIKELRVELVPLNPMEVSTYNTEFSDYPLDEDNLVSLKQLLINGELDRQAKSPADYRQNYVDNATSLPQTNS